MNFRSYCFFNFILLQIFLWQLSSCQNCVFNPRTYLKSGKLAEVHLESDSKVCEEAKPFEGVETCPKGLVNVQFSPTAVIPNTTNVWPYIDLNITVTAAVFVQDVFVQLECLHATNMENSYCHNHTVPIKKWGRMVWPCRQHSIKSPSSSVKLPFTFEHACFRMHGMSQYRVNITLSPQNCMLSYLVTVPMDKQLEPQIAQFFTGDKDTDTIKYPWSPMITVDLNDPDGLGVGFARRVSGDRGDVTVALYKMSSGMVSKQMLMEALPAPESFVSVRAPRGDYLVFVFIDDPHCKLHCPEQDGEGRCSVCPHTFMNFTLTSHRLNGLQSIWYSFVEVIKYFFFALLGFLLVAFLVVIGLYIYVRVIRPRRLARLPPQNIEMTSRPDILIIYTDDCPQHTAAVGALAELLQRHANAKVRIDIFDLNDPSVKPSMWLVTAISEAQFVLLVFSNASPRIMAGDTLIPRRPFPEMFNSAVAMIIAEINEITAREGIVPSNGRQRPRSDFSSSLSKFLTARFMYSDSTCIPEFFNLLPCKSLTIPSDLGLLFGYLHRVDVTHSTSMEHDADLGVLHQAIMQYQHFALNHPNWLDLRFEPKQVDLPPVTAQSAQLPLRGDHREAAVEQIVAKFNLIFPEHDSDLESNASEKFKLMGDADDISSTSSGLN